MNEIERAIDALEMFLSLMLFDPMTGETDTIESLNSDNRELYAAAQLAIAALQEKMEREKGCGFCNTGAHHILKNAICCPRCGKRLEVKQDG